MRTLQFVVFSASVPLGTAMEKGVEEVENFVTEKAGSGAEIGNWFSERLPHMGERKKLVARISKSEPLILKSKPLIFCPLKTRPKTGAKKADKNGGGNKNPAAVVFLKACWLFYA